ncbi:ABC transporter substrate-binding protein [Devosia nitrariae]|uniref:sn-glycerol-3-phosphate-binding periplasmic protein UgpB n=1 Tax=Devosia nitrariae TaxID=2071872 RepID=A0ABQ5W900_9HYPH|nr:sugar ABC transporter substrate-binding protein [Devosia nitrariae]GLQ56511.1 ABC transporter substrate-binding protein [Devosia nitrariae]
MKRSSPFAALVLVAVSGQVLAQETVLRYMSWDPAQLEIEGPAIEEFETAHNVTVETQALPPDDYWPRLSALAAAGDLPDVFAMSSGFVAEWAEAGNLANLGEQMEGVDLNAYYGAAIEAGMVDGEPYAFPQNWVAPVLYYNKDAFDAAGVDYPSDDWTWDDFLNAAKALTIDENGDGEPEQWGYYFYGRYAHTDGWIFRNGGRLINAEETALEPTQEAVNALEFLVGLVSEHTVAPQPQSLEGVRQQDVFPLGMAAMWVDGTWNIDNTRQVAGDSFAWGIAPIPMGPDATPETAVTYAWADMMSIAETSEQKDLAWQFIQHMVGEGRTPADFPGGKVPAYKAIAETESWLEEGLQPDNKGLILELGAQPTYTGFSKNWSAWRGYAAAGSGGMNGEIDEVLNGRKSLDEAIDAFVAYGNDVLSR